MQQKYFKKHKGLTILKLYNVKLSTIFGRQLRPMFTKSYHTKCFSSTGMAMSAQYQKSIGNPSTLIIEKLCKKKQCNKKHFVSCQMFIGQRCFPDFRTNSFEFQISLALKRVMIWYATFIRSNLRPALSGRLCSQDMSLPTAKLFTNYCPNKIIKILTSHILANFLYTVYHCLKLL